MSPPLDDEQERWRAVLANSQQVGERKWLTALLLSILLGYLGGDRFYMGQALLGMLKLFSFGGLGLWWLIDVALIATNRLRDADGNFLER